jgi:hypothetical protein
MIVDTRGYIGEPGLRIDVVELCRHDQRRHDGGAIGAPFGTGELVEDQDAITSLADCAERLEAIDRYERQAMSRRKFAIREFDAARRP